MTTSPLARFADDLEALAADVKGYRFRNSERYVVDVDEIRRRMRDLVDRMRREASVKPNARPTMVSGRPPISGGREVYIERRRTRPRR